MEPSNKPIVASYCTTFLKPEMRHIYRQVTGLRRYDTFVMTRERKCEEEFPFDEIELIPRARKNFLKRFWLKYIRRLPPVYYRGELQVLIKMLRRRPADLMHIYFGHTGVHLLPFIQEWEQPCVVSFHGMDIQPRPDQPGYDDQMAELLRTVPLVMARSESLAEQLVKLGCPREKIRLNRTSIPLDAFPRAERAAPAVGAWRFVQACRLVEKKGLRTTLEAFARFLQNHPQSHLVIAGEGPMQQKAEDLARSLGLEAAVEFRGFLSQAALAELFAVSHIFLHPSETAKDGNVEGVPNSMLEAMATGLPVVATQHGGIPEAVTHERDGLLVPEKDSAALHAAMVRLTTEPGLWQSYGAAAADSVREKFDQARSLEKLEAIYDEARKLGPIRPVSARAPALFAYLFERFPSFVQTFVYREAREMVRQEMSPLVLSIREPEDAPDLAEPLAFPITYLPPEKELRAEIDRRLAARTLPGSVRRALKKHRQERDSQRMFEAAWLGPVLAQHGIRHVHAHFGGMAARTAWWLRELYGIGYSFTGHANDIFCEHDFPVTNAMLVRSAKLVITETDFARRWMEEHHRGSAGKVVRIYNGIAIPEAATPDPAAVRRLLSVGRYVEKKGFADLIEACCLLRERGRAFECLIVGGGPLHAELQQQIDRLQLGDCVKLLGPQPQSEVARLLATAHLFVLACVLEAGGGSDNLPTVVAEAMAAGVPTISTTVAGVPEMITTERDGLLVAPHEPAALAAAIERLLADPALAARLGTAGRETAQRKFAIEQTVRQLKHLLVLRLHLPVPTAAQAQDPELRPTWWSRWQ